VATGLSFTLEQFAKHFKTTTHPVSHKAFSYIRGLFKSEKKRANCTSISDSLAEFDHQSLNHLLSESPWHFQNVLDEIASKTQELFDPTQKTALLLDEVGFRKKGKKSACVGRQYLGCIGKQDNGQVAVVSGLSQGHYYSPIDIKLFMPESWQDDHIRRKQAKIPANIMHQSKPQMALEMIKTLQMKGVKFDYVGFDALYGSSIGLLQALDDDGVSFIGDARDNLKVYLNHPCFSIPSKTKGTPGRTPKIPLADQKDTSLREYVSSLQHDNFTQIAFRDGTKGKVKAQFHRKEIWVCSDRQAGLALKLILIIRKDEDGTTKYSFTNMYDASLEQMAARQGQRVFVERIFEEGKNQIGMGDYQVRSWEGFHKHMTLCFLAFHYILVQKIRHKDEIPLTAPIIRKLVASTIISKWDNTDSAIELAFRTLNRYYHQIQTNQIRDSVT